MCCCCRCVVAEYLTDTFLSRLRPTARTLTRSYSSARRSTLPSSIDLTRCGGFGGETSSRCARCRCASHPARIHFLAPLSWSACPWPRARRAPWPLLASKTCLLRLLFRPRRPRRVTTCWISWAAAARPHRRLRLAAAVAVTISWICWAILAPAVPPPSLHRRLVRRRSAGCVVYFSLFATRFGCVSRRWPAGSDGRRFARRWQLRTLRAF